MPSELLLPTFAVVLLANALLVAIAIRVLVRGRAGSGAEPGAAATRPGMTMAPETDAPALAGAAADSDGQPPDDDDPTEPDGVTTPAAAPAPGASPRAARRRPPARPRTGPRGDSSAKGGEGGRKASRRRFSLPPLDDDHERVSRSIESFLSGGDNAEAEAGVAGMAIATTVAMVAIHGLDGIGVSDREAVDLVLTTVERTLRGAARAADQVTSTGPARWRILLPATGELAARAYLRRVRATVEPTLDAAEMPLRLVTVTATVLDEAADVAIVRADARLEAALEHVARTAPATQPRAAAD